MTGFLQLFLGIAFLVLVCFIAYKIILPICLKIIDLCFESNIFRFGVCIFLALVFCAIGILQLKDFIQETEPEMSKFFPLSFLASGIFLILTFWKRKS